jgi:hypothetical protein
MSIRSILFLACLSFATAPVFAHAEDPGDCQSQEEDCAPPQQPEPVPAPQPEPAPAPAAGFCDGVFRGFLYNQPGPLTLEIRQTDEFGNIEVTGWWAGSVWTGSGLCHQSSPYEAVVNFQFPYTPMQRGVVRVEQNGAAVLDGQVDGGDAFHVVRRPW